MDWRFTASDARIKYGTYTQRLRGDALLVTGKPSLPWVVSAGRANASRWRQDSFGEPDRLLGRNSADQVVHVDCRR